MHQRIQRKKTTEILEDGTVVRGTLRVNETYLTLNQQAARLLLSCIRLMLKRRVNGRVVLTAVVEIIPSSGVLPTQESNKQDTMVPTKT